MSKTININNPLTLIGLFAGLTETVCAAIMPFLNNQDIQNKFLIFVIGFPTLIVVLFFITLNFNKSVLYAPRDYPSNNEKIVDLFLNNSKNQQVLKSQKSSSNVFIDELDISSHDPEFQKQLNFVKIWITKIRSNLPLEFFDEFILDYINPVYYLLEIRINKDKLIKSGIRRHVFVLYVSEHKDYDIEKHMHVGEPYVFGIIAGSGYGKPRQSAENLADYVIDRLKVQINYGT